MSRIRPLLDEFRVWSSPRDGRGSNAFRLVCTLGEPASKEEILAAWGGVRLPEDLVGTWRACRAARMFEDIDYGQWGLRLLSPRESADRTATERRFRPDEFRPDDIVLGEFLGDQELLVRSCSTGEVDDGVLVALPLDGRADWYRVGRDLTDFLERYLASVGEKYWESSG